MRGNTPDIDDEFLEVIRNGIKEYVKSVYHSLREYGVNLKTMPVIFVGGGASVVKRFGEIEQKNINYIVDVKANAKGFEYLGRVALNKWLKRGA